MVRMTPVRRRAAIVEATLAVMLERGLASTTVRDVAQHMGSSPGLIHHYFASMDDLLAAAFEQAAQADLDDLDRLMAEHPDPLERLRVFFAGYTRADQDWAFQLWLDAWAEARRRPAVRVTSQRLNVAWQQLLARTVREGIDSGAVICPDPEGTAWRVLCLIDGLVLQVVTHGMITRDLVVHWSVMQAERELGLPAGTLQPA